MTMKRIGFFRKGFLRTNNGRGVRPMKVSESVDCLKTCNFDHLGHLAHLLKKSCLFGDFILLKGMGVVMTKIGYLCP